MTFINYLKSRFLKINVTDLMCISLVKTVKLFEFLFIFIKERKFKSSKS